MRKNPERLAWFVLLLSFALCSLTVTVVPATAKRLVDEHVSSRGARLDIIYGTVLVHRADTPGEQSAKDAMTVEPGDSVRTAGDARAIIWLFDDSNVELGPDSVVTLSESWRTTFNDYYSAISIDLTAGKPFVNVALPITREREFSVTTSLGALSLGEGSYELDLTRSDAGEVVVRVGRALVSAADKTVVCRTGERVELASGQPPVGPLSLARDIVKDGDFALPGSPEQPLGPYWTGDERNSEGVKGTVERVEHPDGNYLRLWRQGEGHGENYAVQLLERDVSQYRALRLQLDAKLVTQSLSGGGIAGTEYPLHIRILYRDARGREGRYEVGYYFQNDQNLPTTFGQLAEHDVWFQIEHDLTRLDPRPAYLIYVEIAASGWDYETLVRNVRIMAE